MGKKTPPWPVYPEWTTAKFFGMIRGALREAHRKHWQPPKDLAKNQRRNKPDDVPGRHKFENQCAECKGWFPLKDIQRDHTVPCGECNALDEIVPFIERLYVPEEAYQLLCKPCHNAKTNRERKEWKK